MKKIFILTLLLCCFTNTYSQIKVSLKHIEEEDCLMLNITNTDTDTIMINDSHHGIMLSRVMISLYPKDNSTPYKDWHTLGTESSSIIELGPNQTYCYTYKPLTSYKKGPYKKIELYYNLVYRKGSLRNPRQLKYEIIRGNTNPY